MDEEGRTREVEPGDPAEVPKYLRAERLLVPLHRPFPIWDDEHH